MQPAVTGSQHIAVDDGDRIKSSDCIDTKGVDTGLDQQAAYIERMVC